MPNILIETKALRATIDECTQLITQQPSPKLRSFNLLCFWSTPKTHLKQYQHLHPSIRAQVNKLLNDLKKGTASNKLKFDCSDVADVETILDRLNVFRQQLDRQIQQIEADLKKELAKLDTLNDMHPVLGIEAAVKCVENNFHIKTLRKR